MKAGVGLQAISVMKELEGKYPGNQFKVAVLWLRKKGDATQYGYAFRDAAGKATYAEQQPYQ
jgi:hypothetical protein